MLISEQLRVMLVCQGLVGHTLVVTSDPVSQPGLKQQGRAGPKDGCVWSPGPGIPEEQAALSQTQERKLPSAEKMDPASASARPLQTWFLITQAGHELAMKQGTASNSQSSCLNLLDAQCLHLFY